MNMEMQQSRNRRIEAEIVLDARDLALSRRVGQLESELAGYEPESLQGSTVHQKIDISVAPRPAVCAPMPLPLTVADLLVFEGPRQLLQQRCTDGRRASGPSRSGID